MLYEMGYTALGLTLINGTGADPDANGYRANSLHGFAYDTHSVIQSLLDYHIVLPSPIPYRSNTASNCILYC